MSEEANDLSASTKEIHESDPAISLSLSCSTKAPAHERNGKRSQGSAGGTDARTMVHAKKRRSIELARGEGGEKVGE